jgi:hypothetical protein
MGRRKAWWTGQLFSYGPTYVDGKIVGFHVNLKIDDHTESGRLVEIPMDAQTLRRMAELAEKSEGS